MKQLLDDAPASLASMSRRQGPRDGDAVEEHAQPRFLQSAKAIQDHPSCSAQARANVNVAS